MKRSARLAVPQRVQVPETSSDGTPTDLGRGLCLVAAFGALFLTVACERKAPSPDECLDYAMLTLHVNDQRLLAVAEVKDQVDSVVIKCLTTPYDKELIACTKRRSGSSSCFLEFRDRELRRGNSRN